MSNCCSNNTCGCTSCDPAKYSKCDFNIVADPFDPRTWVVTTCGTIQKIKIPKISETCTSLSINSSNSTLIYKGECGTNNLTGAQIGEIVRLGDLRDLDTETQHSCDLLVFNPRCDDDCADCRSIEGKWENYHIENATEVVEDNNGYYNVLVKDDCGCIVEKKLPVVGDMNSISCYIRDSVPDDPDWPWYYGCYNEDINLYLEQNAGKYFGKYDLEVTVNYGIQAVKSSVSKNVNFRSLMLPVVEGTTPDAEHMSSILQSNTTYSPPSREDIPWGTISLRGTITFIVPKGKEAHLHHEYRLRTNSSFPNYYTSQYDGQRVPTEIAGQFDRMVHNASRLNQLQIIVRPAFGYTDKSPVIDVARNQLDAPVDIYPNPIVGV